MACPDRSSGSGTVDQVLLTIASVLIGVGIGLSLRPRPTRFARPKIRLVPALVVGVFSQLIANPVQDCGMAPSPVPSSASQYSASPEVDAPRTLVAATSAPARHSK